MKPEYQEQLQRLQQVRGCFVLEGHVWVYKLMIPQFRRSLTEQNKQNGAEGSTTHNSRGNTGQYELGIRNTVLGSSIENEPPHDPMIYPGLYAPSGIDMMGILVCYAFFL